MLLDHTKEMKALNALYSKYITALIFAFTFIACSLMHSSLNSHKTESFLMIPWIVAASTYFNLIFLYTIFSSRTLYLNRKLYFELHSYQISLCKSNKSSFSGIIHLNLVNEYRTLFLRTCFRLKTSSPLNNKFLFFNLFPFISGVYFKILDRK